MRPFQEAWDVPLGRDDGCWQFRALRCANEDLGGEEGETVLSVAKGPTPFREKPSLSDELSRRGDVRADSESMAFRMEEVWVV